jgi:hypothetical protein
MQAHISKLHQFTMPRALKKNRREYSTTINIIYCFILYYPNYPFAHFVLVKECRTLNFSLARHHVHSTRVSGARRN